VAALPENSPRPGVAAFAVCYPPRKTALPCTEENNLAKRRHMETAGKRTRQSLPHGKGRIMHTAKKNCTTMPGTRGHGVRSSRSH
jgi:hypothetical protein